LNFIFLSLFPINSVLFFAAVDSYDSYDFDLDLHHPYYYRSVKAPLPIDEDEEEKSLHYKSSDKYGYYEKYDGGRGDAPFQRSTKAEALAKACLDS
jgi:hypothetical protein